MCHGSINTNLATVRRKPDDRLEKDHIVSRSPFTISCPLGNALANHAIELPWYERLIESKKRLAQRFYDRNTRCPK